MLHAAGELVGRHLRARDGRAGIVDDILFNEETWAVTWLVAELGSWFEKRPALVPRSALLALDPGSLEVGVALDQRAITAGPAAGGDFAGPTPCSWDGFWMDGLPASHVLGPRPHPSAHARTRALHDVLGCEVEALGGPAGHVSSLLVDDREWSVRHLVVHVGSSLFGREVLVPVDRIRCARWDQRTFLVDVRQGALGEDLAYDPELPVTPDAEARLSERSGRRP